MLRGSGELPSYVSVGGKMVQLGEVIGRAFDESKLTEEAWNLQSQAVIQDSIEDALAGMRAEARGIFRASLVERLVLEPGDVLAVTVPKDCPADEQEQIGASIRDFLAKANGRPIPVLIMTDTIKLRVVKSEEKT